ncbi:hypothetical protein ACCI49_00795 [Microbulbifer epialgicus]|uniref:Uncharacterized protein n=1 Tax=Microbulbifer epialgicus TaxID=393907 RepID=A0ABV4NTM0_9GAMM
MSSTNLVAPSATVATCYNASAKILGKLDYTSNAFTEEHLVRGNWAFIRCERTIVDLLPHN